MKIFFAIAAIIIAANCFTFGQNAVEIYNKALTEYEQNNFIEAEKLFDEFFKWYTLEDELYSSAKYHQAEILLKMNKTDAAADMFKTFIKTFNWSVYRLKSINNLALIYFEKGQYEEARKYFAIIIEQYPSSEFYAVSVYRTGVSYLNDNEIEKGITTLEEALNITDRNYYQDYIIYSLAGAYEKMGDYESAIKNYDNLLTFHPNSTLALQAQIRIGICYFKLKDYYASILELNNPVLTELPKEKYAESLYMLANSFYSVQEFANAEKTYSELIQNFSFFRYLKDVKYALGLTYFQEKKYNDAYKVFNSLSDGKDRIAIKSYFWKGESKRYSGNDKEAIDIFKSFIDRFPADSLTSRAKYVLGMIYYTNKKYLEAEDILLSAVETAGNYDKAKAYTLLGELNLAKKRFTYAKQNYNASLNVPDILEDDLRNRSLLGLGIASFYLGEFEDAVVSLSDLALRVPNFEKSKVNFYLAESFFANKKYGDALDKYNLVDQQSKEVSNNALYGKAYSYFNLKNYESAAYYFNEYLKSYPKDDRIIDVKFRIADCYYASKNYAAANTIYDDLFRAKDDVGMNPFNYFQYAQSLHRSGKTAQAIKIYYDIEKDYPNSDYAAKALYSIGWISFENGDYTAALNIYKDAIIKYPDKQIVPLLYYSIGDCLFNLEQYEEAINNYQTVLTEYPKSNVVYDAVNGIQTSFAALGQPERSVAYIDEYVKTNPNVNFSDKLGFKKGEVYFNKNEYQMAIQSFREFITNFPQSNLVPDAYFFIGKSAASLNQTDEAVMNFRKAIELSPSNDTKISSMIEAGNAFQKAKRYDEAVSMYDGALEKLNNTPRSAEVLYFKGMTYLDKGDFNMAAESFGESATYYKGEIYSDKSKLELGLIESAVDHFENAEMYFRNLADSRNDELGAQGEYYYGVTQLDQKKFNEAITSFVRVKTNFPTYDEWVTKSYLKLGECYTHLKDNANAKEMYRKVLETHKNDVYSKEAQNKLKGLR